MSDSGCALTKIVLEHFVNVCQRQGLREDLDRARLSAAKTEVQMRRQLNDLRGKSVWIAISGDWKFVAERGQDGWSAVFTDGSETVAACIGPPITRLMSSAKTVRHRCKSCHAYLSYATMMHSHGCCPACGAVSGGTIVDCECVPGVWIFAPSLRKWRLWRWEPAVWHTGVSRETTLTETGAANAARH